MIKWIVSDMDGTLLNDENQISIRTKNKLIECQESGIRLILASGRSYRKMINFANELQMDKYGGALIEVNGLIINEFNDNPLTKKSMLEQNHIYEIFNFAKNYDVEIIGMNDDKIYDYFSDTIKTIKSKYREDHQLEDNHPWLGGFKKWVAANKSDHFDTIIINKVEDITEPLNKICFKQDPEVIEAFYNDFAQQYGEQYEIVHASPRWLECMRKGITKGSALQELMNLYQIKPEEVIAFGDGENDCSVFNVVKKGIAMSNAMQPLKDIADEICPSNQEDGIAITLEKYEQILCK